MPDDKKREIQARLRQIEREENVCIFYACESGSRAWGFPSEDSDCDVRFMYIHSKDWYLSIDERRDVIEIRELRLLRVETEEQMRIWNEIMIQGHLPRPHSFYSPLPLPLLFCPTGHFLS